MRIVHINQANTVKNKDRYQFFVWLSAFATAAFECVKRYTLFLTGMIVYIKINVAGVV